MKKIKERILSVSHRGLLREQQTKKKEENRQKAKERIFEIINEVKKKSKKNTVESQVIAIYTLIKLWNFTFAEFNITKKYLDKQKRKGFESEAMYWLSLAKDLAQYSEVAKEIKNFQKYLKKSERGYSYFNTSKNKIKKLLKQGIKNNILLN